MPQSGLEKAAILLLTLGPEAAASVLRHLSEREARQVSTAIARLRSIPRAEAAAVHEEAWRRLSERDGLPVDGEQFARQMLAATLSEEREALARGVERPPRPAADLLAASLEPVAPAALAQLLASEHPQVIALVLANLPPRKAAAVLGSLPEGLQPDIVERITNLERVPEDILAELGDVLRGQVQGLGRAAAGPSFVGAKLAAEMMNVADPALEARVLAQLDAQVPEVAEMIRSLMLTFEDLVRLDDRAMQALLKEVARDDLMLALRTASSTLRQKIFGNIPHRAAEILEEDMSTMGPVRLKDAEDAQARVVAAARRLEAERRITIGASGDDELV